MSPARRDGGYEIEIARAGRFLLALSAARCWMRATLSRAVPSSSVSLASITTCGLNSLGMRRTGRVPAGLSSAARSNSQGSVSAKTKISVMVDDTTSWQAPYGERWKRPVIASPTSPHEAGRCGCRGTVR